MRIAVFTETFLPHVDGITNSLVHLVTQYKKMGHEVLVIAPKIKGTDTVHLEGINIIFLPSVPAMVYPEFMLGLLSPELVIKLRKFSPEIVHAIAPGTVGNMGLMYAKLVNIKSVATFHGYFMEPEYLRVIGIKKRGVKLAQKVLWKVAKSFYDRADKVITPSQFVKKDLELHNFVRQIVVIKNAIDFSSVKKSAKEHADFIKKYNLANKKVILYIGRVSVEKNIETVIKALVDIIQKVPDVHLLIVGNGPDKSRLEELVATLQLQKHVTFTGEIKNTDLVKKDVFGVAQVFATASHSEVQPVSIIEAMHFGLPIVAAKSRGMVEMITTNGFLVDSVTPENFAQPLITLLLDTDLRNQYAKSSQELAHEYSLEFSAKKHIELYTNLIKNIEDSSFARRVLKSRVIRSFKDVIFVAGIIHISVLIYLFYVTDQIEHITVYNILDLEKLFPNMLSTWNMFMISGVCAILVFVFYFLRNKRDE